MNLATRKAAVELANFRSFVDAARIPVLPGSERNGSADLREPDILCTISGQPEGFELTAACAPQFAAAATQAAKSPNSVAVAFGQDVSHDTLRGKLKKKYLVSCPVHLLIYRGLTALTDEMIIERLQPELQHGLGQFTNIWFHGDKVHLLATSDS